MLTLFFLQCQFTGFLVAADKKHFLFSIQFQVFRTAFLEQILPFLDTLYLYLQSFLNIVAIVGQAKTVTDGFLRQPVIHLGFQLSAFLTQFLPCICLLLFPVSLRFLTCCFLFLRVRIGNVIRFLGRSYDYLWKRHFSCRASLANGSTNGSTSSQCVPTCPCRRWSRKHILDRSFHIIEICDSRIGNGLEPLCISILDLIPIQSEDTLNHGGHAVKFIDQQFYSYGDSCKTCREPCNK